MGKKRKKIRGINADSIKLCVSDTIHGALGVVDEEELRFFERESYRTFEEHRHDPISVQIHAQLDTFKNDAVMQILALYTLASVLATGEEAEERGREVCVVRNKHELINALIGLLGAPEDKPDVVM